MKSLSKCINQYRASLPATVELLKNLCIRLWSQGYFLKEYIWFESEVAVV